MKTPDVSSGPATRLLSLDALRGVDMFWLTGGVGILVALARGTGNEALRP